MKSKCYRDSLVTIVTYFMLSTLLDQILNLLPVDLFQVYSKSVEMEDKTNVRRDLCM